MDNFSDTIKKRILDGNVVDFEDIALNIFRYQYHNNAVYKKYNQSLGVELKSVSQLEKIPYLPISAFKYHRVTTGSWAYQDLFLSSGTTGQSSRSHHYIKDKGFYLAHAHQCFTQLCDIDLSNTILLACLPSYHQQRASSLIAMIDDFIRRTDDVRSGFYEGDIERLSSDLEELMCTDKTILLFGVTYALLDFFESRTKKYNYLKVFVTGGMKGRRKEMTPQELLAQLSKYIPRNQIYGEYGMTELLSQAYSSGAFRYKLPDTMRVSAVEITDPMAPVNYGSSGLLRIIDLANVDSCAFIQTDDLCKIYTDESFEILGRLDYSDIRGCSLLTA